MNFPKHCAIIWTGFPVDLAKIFKKKKKNVHRRNMPTTIYFGVKDRLKLIHITSSRK